VGTDDLRLGISIQVSPPPGQRRGGPSFPELGDDQRWYFAAGRFRSPTALGTVTAGKESTVHKVEFYSPAYPTTDFRFGIPAHYTKGDGSVPSEFAVSSFQLAGFAMHAFIDGQWETNVCINTASAVSVNASENSVGFITPSVSFSKAVPPNTRCAAVSRVVLANGAAIGVSVRNRTGTNEFARIDATDAQLINTGVLTGTDGRLGGQLFAPSFAIARPTSGLDRPVFWINGDSIAWGKNENENVLVGNTYGGMGFIARALEDDARSRRMAFYNSAIPGVGPGEQKSRDAWDMKLDLIRLCPNRPYTHAITEHYNNLSGSNSQFQANMASYFATLKAETNAWGTGTCLVYQSAPIPRPNSSDYHTSVANQGSDPNGVYPTGPRWLFDADLRSGFFSNVGVDGVVESNRDYALDSTTDDRDKVDVLSYSSNLTSALASGNTQVSVADTPAVGDYLIVDPGGANMQGRHVTGVSGAGPFVATCETAFSVSLPTGAAVKTSLVGDTPPGLHPSSPGHVRIADVWIDWKNGTFG
jgi:hypothetical protein